MAAQTVAGSSGARMLSPNATTADALAALKQDGYCVIPGMLPDALCDEMLACIECYMGGGWPRSLDNPFHGHKTFRFFDLLNADPVWRELPVQPRIYDIAKKVLGNDCLLSTFGTVSIAPTEPAQHIHTDDIIYRTKRPHPEVYMNIIMALSDFTLENGATHVLPGSNHLLEEPDSSKTYPTVQAVMPKGSCLFVLGSTWHHGGANNSDRIRWDRNCKILNLFSFLTGCVPRYQFRHGVTMAYSAGYLRPMENFQVGVAEEKAATFHPDLAKLMGWSIGNRGRLGMSFSHVAKGPLHKLIKL